MAKRHPDLDFLDAEQMAAFKRNIHLDFSKGILQRQLDELDAVKERFGVVTPDVKPETDAEKIKRLALRGTEAVMGRDKARRERDQMAVKYQEEKRLHRAAAFRMREAQALARKLHLENMELQRQGPSTKGLDIAKLIQLCHPDRHPAGLQALANEITAELLKRRKN